MALLNDSLTVALLLIMIFGSTAFYLYTRLLQNEKRVALLENLLLSLKMSTEASFMGADMFRSEPEYVQAMSSPSPLNEEDVDVMDEDKYAEMLKEIPTEPVPAANAAPSDIPTSDKKGVDVNYEAMTLKELQAVGRQNGVSVHGMKKKDIIDSLKKKTRGTEFEGAELGIQGFVVNLEEKEQEELQQEKEKEQKEKDL